MKVDTSTVIYQKNWGKDPNIGITILTTEIEYKKPDSTRRARIRSTAVLLFLEFCKFLLMSCLCNLNYKQWLATHDFSSMSKSISYQALRKIIDVARTFVINVITKLDTWLTFKAWIRGLLLGTAIPFAWDIVMAILIPMVPKTDTIYQDILSNGLASECPMNSLSVSTKDIVGIKRIHRGVFGLKTQARQTTTPSVITY